jgi:hypothetical protein
MSRAGQRADPDRLREHLWPEGVKDAAVFAILDGARDREVTARIRFSGLDHECLYSGDLAPRLQAAAPYVVRLEPNSDFTYFVLGEAWGESWGIFAITFFGRTIGDVRHHFRRFLQVKDESGKKLVFRFYDPRVLRAYLPTCTPAEAEHFFGPVSVLMAENEGGDGVLAYRIRAGGVRADEMVLVP